MHKLYKQARSLLLRWGYKPIEGKLLPSGDEMCGYALWVQANRPGDVWAKHSTSLIVPSSGSLFTDRNEFNQLLVSLASIHGFSQGDTRRMIEAEPFDRNLGTIELYPQPFKEWGDREVHAPATLRFDGRGRDRLIAALIEGLDSIEIYGESGGSYTLDLEKIQALINA